ncbi:MAG: decarboxylating 6-phosphogluconate dehydrogenase [Akkermansiaceae bacterium]|nr:decarboxylating 6-phosphogluconate dehydrogenase [Armatimonadota bacterium]
MEISFIGLGRMGGNMAVRLAERGHTVYGADPSAETRELVEGQGIAATVPTARELSGLYKSGPRVFWLMVPAGPITDGAITEIAANAKPGDIIVDGGNANYKDTLRRAKELEAHGIHYADCGTSGGVWGLKNGYCLMVGAAPEAFAALEPALKDLATDGGYAHVGPVGAGHFTKMVHNGIEYGLLQAYAEGFELLHSAKEFDLDLAKVTALWNKGSVVRSWLLELAERAFTTEGQEFEGIADDIADNGTGRWTVEESVDRAVPLPVITLALQMRFRSRQDESYQGQFIAALRNQFGGHATTAAKQESSSPGATVPSGGKKDL